jgi:CheY-like chemotaxis protein
MRSALAFGLIRKIRGGHDMSYQHYVRDEAASGYGYGEVLWDFPDVGEPESDLHVMFISEDPMIADVYGRKLTIDGYRMTFVWHEAEAYSTALRILPDVIYLDLTASADGGLRILRAIRNDPITAAIPVVLLVDTLREKPLALGKHDFVIPVGGKAEFVHRATGLRRARQHR